MPLNKHKKNAGVLLFSVHTHARGSYLYFSIWIKFDKITNYCMTIISHTAGENIEGAFSILLLLNLRLCSFEDEEKLV